MTTPDTVVAILSLPACDAIALRGDGPTGLALRSALADAAGLPVWMAFVIGARCSNDPHGLHYVTFEPADPVNAYVGGGGSSVLAPPEDVVSGGAALLVDTRVSTIPLTPADLGRSSTGLPALAGLTADVNVQSRIAAMGGTVDATFAAAAAAEGYGVVVVDSAAVDAGFAAVAAAWGGVVGNATVAGGNVGVASVAYAPPSTAAAPPYLWWLPLPIAFGAVLVLAFVAAYLVVSNGVAATPAGVVAAVLSGTWWAAATPAAADGSLTAGASSAV